MNEKIIAFNGIGGKWPIWNKSALHFACFTIPSDLVESRIITMLAQMRFPWEMVSKRSFAWEVYTKKQRIWTSQLMVLDCLYFRTAQLSLEPSSSQKQPCPQWRWRSAQGPQYSHLSAKYSLTLAPCTNNPKITSNNCAVTELTRTGHLKQPYCYQRWIFDCTQQCQTWNLARSTLADSDSHRSLSSSCLIHAVGV